jgi:hypothetical protein
MSNSLADQLLKAGIVSEEDVARTEKQKKQGKKRPNKAKNKKPPQRSTQASTGSNTGEVANAAARKAVEAGKKATQKDAQKKQQQQDAEKRRLLNLQILEALKDVKVEDPDGEIKFNYLYQNKVRGIYISASQRDRLVAKEMAITVLKAKTKLIPMTIVETLKGIDPERFIFIVEDDAKTEDDEYADHQIPDDLMW